MNAQTIWKYRGLIWKYRRPIWKYRNLWKYRGWALAATAAGIGYLFVCLSSSGTSGEAADSRA